MDTKENAVAYIFKKKNEMGKEKMEKIKFAKVDKKAIIPSKERENAGYDIYGNYGEKRYIVLEPMETKLISTGIACALPEGYYFQVEERGSTGSKGIKRSAGVVDSGYRGEIFVALTNCNNVKLIIGKKEEFSNIKELFEERLQQEYIFYPQEKAIAQLILHKVPELEVEEISYEELKEIPSQRGAGKLGSSGK